MSDLTFIERRRLEELLGMGGGYVLDFSNRTLEEFVRDVIGCDIYDTRYDRASGSKANRIRAFWDEEGNQRVAQLLDAFFEIVVEKEHDAPLLARCKAIADRLRGPTSAEDSRPAAPTTVGATTAAVGPTVSGPKTSGPLDVPSLLSHRLRKVIRELPTRETDVQDAVEVLLIGAGVEYRREGPSIEYSSKNYVPDFSIRSLDLAVEVKLCRQGREKTLIAEINDDIVAYRTRFSNLLFVVYDTGQIRDVDRFSVSLERNDGVIVRVIKH